MNSLRADETPEEHSRRLESRRDFHANLSPKSREIRLAQVQDNTNMYRQKETPQQAEARKVKDKIATSKRRKGYVVIFYYDFCCII